MPTWASSGTWSVAERRGLARSDADDDFIGETPRFVTAGGHAEKIKWWDLARGDRDPRQKHVRAGDWDLTTHAFASDPTSARGKSKSIGRIGGVDFRQQASLLDHSIRFE